MIQNDMLDAHILHIFKKNAKINISIDIRSISNFEKRNRRSINGVAGAGGGGLNKKMFAKMRQVFDELWWVTCHTQKGEKIDFDRSILIFEKN